MHRLRGGTARILLLVGLAAIGMPGCGSGGGAGSAKGFGTGFGGAQDSGYFRAILEEGRVPGEDDITYEGFLAEHDFPLPAPGCAELLCGHGVIGLGPSAQPGHRTLLQFGLNTLEDPEKYGPSVRNLAIVIDRSGSMSSGNKLPYVKTGVLRLIDELVETDILSIVTYDSVAQVLRPAAPLADKHEVKKLVEGIGLGGATNLDAGMVKGYEQALRHYDPQAANRVILLTDGMANTGVTDPDRILANSKAYTDQGISITTIGVGTAYNQDLMLRLARQGGGNNYFLDDPTRSEEVFVEELYSLYTEAARDLHIEIVPGPGFTSIEAFGAGTSAIQPDGTVVIDVPSVFFAPRQGVLLIEMDVVGAGTSPLDLAEIRYEYVRTDTGVLEGDTITPVVGVDTPYDPGASQYDTVSTRKALVVLEIVKAFRQAAREYHDESIDRAVAEATLRDLETFVLGHQAVLADPEIDDDLVLIGQFIGNVTP